MPPVELNITGDYVRQHLQSEGAVKDIHRYIL